MKSLKVWAWEYLSNLAFSRRKFKTAMWILYPPTWAAMLIFILFGMREKG